VSENVGSVKRPGEEEVLFEVTVVETSNLTEEKKA
jgi:hypothetical protein